MSATRFEPETVHLRATTPHQDYYAMSWQNSNPRHGIQRQYAPTAPACNAICNPGDVPEWFAEAGFEIRHPIHVFGGDLAIVWLNLTYLVVESVLFVGVTRQIVQQERQCVGSLEIHQKPALKGPCNNADRTSSLKGNRLPLLKLIPNPIGCLHYNAMYRPLCLSVHQF